MTNNEDSITRREIFRVVENYIGTSGGYLGDFSYRTHSEFYPVYCDLDIEPDSYGGTTRERFMEILRTQSPLDQIKILRGVMDKYPVGSDILRTSKTGAEIQQIISRLEGQVIELQPTIGSTRTALREALSDAETMIRGGKPENAVDRIHTAFHDHLKAICDDQNWNYDRSESTGKLFRNIVDHHPELRHKGERGQDITMILRGMATIISSLNPIRNQVSLAHPNESLLPEPEAFLYINTVRTVMRYLDQKLGHR